MKTSINFLLLFIAQSFIIVNCGAISPGHSEALLQTPSGSNLTSINGTNNQEEQPGIHVSQPDDNSSATHEMTDEDGPELIEGSTPPPLPIPETPITPPWFDDIALIDAVLMGNLEAVKYRICVGDNATAEREDRDPFMPIHAAAANGELAILKYFVEEAGVPVDSTNGYGWTPLYFGAEGCHLHVIKYLLEKGANLSSITKAGSTPIHTAVESNCVKAITYFLEQKAELAKERDHERGGNNTLLHIAVKWGRIQTVAAFLDGGAPLEAKNGEGLTPLHFAISIQASNTVRTNMVKYLIARGADVTTVDARGNTLLRTVAKFSKYSDGSASDLSLVTYLMESGAQLDEETVMEFIRVGWTSSPLAQYVMKVWRNNCSEGSPTTQAPPPPPPNSHQTQNVPLEYSYMDLEQAIRSGDVDAARFRVSAGDNVSSFACSSSVRKGDPCSRLKPLINVAVESGNLDMVKFLVEEAGVDIRAAPGDYPDESPLHVSMQPFHDTPSGSRVVTCKATVMEVVRYLVAHGANLNAKNSEGKTALHVGAGRTYLEPVQYLVRAGADVNAKDKRGRTPLHEAVVHQPSIHIAYFLVEHGASVNAGDERGLTPLATSLLEGRRREGSNLPLIKYLVRSGADVNAQSQEYGSRRSEKIADYPLTVRVSDFLREAGLLEVSGVKCKDAGSTPMHINM